MKNRNPYLSFILTFVFSGLGQVYNGELGKGVIFLFLNVIFFLFLGLLGLISSFKGLIALVILMILFKIVISLEAYNNAKTISSNQLKSINSIWKYIIFFLLSFLVNRIGIYTSRSVIGYEAFEIPTPSMEPSILVGDNIIASRINPKDIQIGDIITFTQDDGQKYLSRAVGLPGDKIEIINDKVSINGQSEQWNEIELIKDNEIEYQKYSSRLPNYKEIGTLKMLKYNGRQFPIQEISNQEVMIVPEDEIFVLGDNRNNSMDSRMYGTVPFENIDKQVYYVWWSNDKSRIGEKLND